MATAVITARVSSELDEAIRRAAERQGVKVSVLVAEALAERFAPATEGLGHHGPKDRDRIPAKIKGVPIVTASALAAAGGHRVQVGPTTPAPGALLIAKKYKRPAA